MIFSHLINSIGVIGKSNSMYREDRGRGRGFGAPREMHKAICAECEKECEVPFKPDGDRPVYCRDCYQKRKPRRF